MESKDTLSILFEQIKTSPMCDTSYGSTYCINKKSPAEAYNALVPLIVHALQEGIEIADKSSKMTVHSGKTSYPMVIEISGRTIAMGAGVHSRVKDFINHWINKNSKR